MTVLRMRSHTVLGNGLAECKSCKGEACWLFQPGTAQVTFKGTVQGLPQAGSLLPRRPILMPDVMYSCSAIPYVTYVGHHTFWLRQLFLSWLATAVLCSQEAPVALAKRQCAHWRRQERVSCSRHDLRNLGLRLLQSYRLPLGMCACLNNVCNRA